ncbi:MAG TPA: D-alanyl-D-alanine carboxypeptidase/D-alanyl-D-alanine-endopeptidase [Micrococcales bacterium]|nr:D-alanyl-D-alanine carboxypeptidase/D-alanyl-D-alanine-endopeptidase [Micrococcales bacterium]
MNPRSRPRAVLVTVWRTGGPNTCRGGHTRRRSSLVRTRRVLVGGVGALVAIGLVTGYVAADARGLVPGPFTTDAPWPEAEPFPTPTISTPLPAAAVLPSLDDSAPVPTAAGLADAVAALRARPEVGTPPGLIVVDAASGDVLADADAHAARLPASTTKVLTAAAAVSTLDLEATLPTTARLDGDTLYLVGGGDMALAAGAGDPSAVLGRAGLGDLADRTVAALQAAGTTSVALRFDDTLFDRTPRAQGWSEIDLSGGFVAPIQAMGIMLGVVDGQVRRDSTPSDTAAETFAQALRDRGIEVREGPSRSFVPDGATEVARVESAPLVDLLDLAMADSSNTLTEVFGRLVAVDAGLPATFEGAASGVLNAVANLGIDVTGTSLADTSGLSSLNRISPRLLADVLVKAATDPQLRPLVVALPVAGLEGTLAGRSLDDGLVRAKTGTLPSVVSLAGYTPTADGRLLVFAVIADGVPTAGSYAARLEIDAWVRSLTACGCS